MKAWFIDTLEGFIDFNDRTGLVETLGFNKWLTDLDDVVKVAQGLTFKVRRNNAEDLYLAALTFLNENMPEEEYEADLIGFSEPNLDELLQVPRGAVV